ncbi:MAG: hypothetical protein CML16_05635 [Pusillimonas sp.]|nr:hypothetical protein [Pusillimonas sp.]MBC42593.1 hypothetical protein [Pusillimonas sp.]|tara:strand:- start:19487 stop:20743 length:1257 start_codon:yes stop_codon:yes gene_type:complete
MSELIPAGWRLVAVDEIAKTHAGGTPSTQINEYWEGGDIPWMSSGEIHKKRIIQTDQRITTLGYQNSSAKFFPQKTVLVALAGQGKTRGTVAISEIPLTTNQSIAGIVISDKTTAPDYIFHNLDSRYEELRAASGGSGRAGLNLSIIGEQCLLLPPLPEQQKIATILSSVDDVIEKTRTQIDKLKDLKTGMMQELLTQGIGHTEFKDSPVGRIPASWSVASLEQVALLSRGRFSHRPRNDPMFYGGQYPFLQTGDIPKEATLIKSHSQTLNERGYKVSKVFPKGTLVITIAATIGEVGVLNFDACFPDSLVGITAKNDLVHAYYLVYILKHLSSDLKSLAPQTAQKNINLEVLNPFEIPLPPLREQKLIADAIGSVDEELYCLLAKLSQIKKIKKALMQDLLTGKVRVNVDNPEVAAA